MRLSGELEGDIDDEVFLPANEAASAELQDDVALRDAVAGGRTAGVQQEGGVQAGAAQ